MVQRRPVRPACSPLLLLIPAALLAAPSAWAAEPSPADQALADGLFNEGLALIVAGRVAEACPKFEAAQRLEPTVGTQMNLANCLEKLGRTASAFALFQDAAATARKAGDTLRQGISLGRAKALEAKLSKLTIVVGANRPPGFLVTRGGQPVLEAMWNSALPLDPGDHAMEASAPGRITWQGTATVRPEGSVYMIEIPELAVAPVEKRVGGGGWGPQRAVGASVAGVGIVGLVLGAAFGAKALSQNASADASCRPADHDKCSAQGVALHHDALASAHVSTAGLVIGGAALAAGVALFASAPRAKAPADTGRFEAFPLVGAGIGGLALRATW